MNRIVSLLLIPFFVLGQALPHSHAGSGIAEPDGHAERPHVHVSTHDHGNGSHSHGDHQSESGNAIDNDGFSSATEHDSDAVYLVASPDLMTLPTQSTAVGGLFADWQAVIPLAAKSDCQFRSGAPPNRYATLPIFLLKASLRL